MTESVAVRTVLAVHRTGLPVSLRTHRDRGHTGRLFAKALEAELLAVIAGMRIVGSPLLPLMSDTGTT